MAAAELGRWLPTAGRSSCARYLLLRHFCGVRILVIATTRGVLLAAIGLLGVRRRAMPSHWLSGRWPWGRRPPIWVLVHVSSPPARIRRRRRKGPHGAQRLHGRPVARAAFRLRAWWPRGRGARRVRSRTGTLRRRHVDRRRRKPRRLRCGRRGRG